MPTKIAWTNETWNPVTGCTKISPGCANCYAEALCRRFWRQWDRDPPPDHFKVRLHPERLLQPRGWKKPRRVFGCSMGDLFHKDVSGWFLVKVFWAMRQTPQHTFQVLTKRADLMHEWCRHNLASDNVQLMVTAENQECADERISHLRNTPAVVRGVSVEPMLGPVDLSLHLANNSMFKAQRYVDKVGGSFHGERLKDGSVVAIHQDGTQFLDGVDLDWVIIGCESGPQRRPMELEWAIDLVRQCQAAGVACFVKQVPVNGKVSKDPSEWPEKLRVREYPK